MHVDLDAKVKMSKFQPLKLYQSFHSLKHERCKAGKSVILRPAMRISAGLRYEHHLDMAP
jgi:hypothetical protein